MKFAWWLLKFPFRMAFYSVSKRERKVTAEIEHVHALARDGDVVGLIRMLDSDVRGRSQSRIVRDHAATALGQLGDPRAIPHLVEMRDDPEEFVRFGVIQALARLKAKEAEEFLLATLDDPSPLLRMTAAEALGHLGELDAIPALRKTLDTDPDPHVRVHAVEALVILGDDQARDRVAEALSAVERRSREHPRYNRIQEAVDRGEPLTPWVSSWESNPPGQNAASADLKDRPE